MAKIDRIAEAGAELKKVYGETPKDRIVIYITTNSTASSNMSGKYSAYIMVNNEPRCRSLFPAAWIQ